MAKGPDHLVDSFATENTGGLLSGLLAEENIFDRSSLLRLGSWGVVSVAAVIVALYASQSSMALRREQVAAVDLARQTQQIQSLAKDSQNETRRLASAVDTLNGDRDRLFTRVTVLEQGLDSVTGAITRQTAASLLTTAAPATAATATTAPAATVPAAAPEPETEAVPGPGAVSAPAPAVTPVATTVAKNAPADKSPAEKGPAKVTTAALKAPPPPPVMPAPLVAAKSIMAPPDAAATKLIESENPEKPAKLITSAPIPDVVASASPADDAESEAAETPPPKVEVQRTEFGVDLGGANSLGGLRALWRGLLKSRSNAALTGLRPIIVIREGRNGLGMQLRLVAGPFSDAAAAAKICAGLIENDRSCETAVFDGQRLIVNPSESNAAVDKSVADKPAAAKPAATKPFVYRRGYSRRGANGEPAKKPDPASSFSSLFSRR